MLKKEFLELVKDIEEDGEIDETILSNGFSKQIKDLDGLKNLLDTNELVKGIYQKELDSGVGKGVTKYKENFNKNELPKLVEEGIKAKSNEGKSPLEIKVEEQQREIEQMKAEKVKAEMSSKYTKDLSTKGLPTDLIDFVLGADEDTTNANIEKISNILSSVTDTKVKEKLNNSNYVPPKNDSKTFGKPTWDDVMKGKASYEDFKKSQES
ncbi:hypothetical protein CBE01nite_29650 [Clostridium beijerinckii]|uniref:DUF4355 domain-containing protein n=1 Tax=Clostridium beijerinckii TaxID=1520 RepID=A0AB74VD93_CLOBE|nr:DUF4355 domain-containing protein [Clostridium beijerinckii]NRZ28745.1 hypothetical protein [Clostridium beijerinckii]NYB95479.1 hypothetical protein [Clostridium beijerinckii]OOM24594.1 hypothetical protein CLBEI_20550 [Clostridium beijerinckii]QUN34423.1 DUF4355 domain-containing protein [Clostridium beijerinckii]SQB00623.1 Uncharacterised protein [Clostridium beijerinckii]